MPHLTLLQALVPDHVLYPLIGRQGFEADASAMMRDVYRTARADADGSPWLRGMVSAIGMIAQGRKLSARFGGKSLDHRSQPRTLVEGLGGDRVIIGIRTGAVREAAPGVVKLSTPVGAALRELFRPRAFGGLLGEGTEAIPCLWAHALVPGRPNAVQAYLLHDLLAMTSLRMEFASSVSLGEVTIDRRLRGYRNPTGTTPPLPDLS